MSRAWDVVVIGAGAAGLLAATRAAERGRRVLLLEKNRRAGTKILMSGGTRCNVTHATDRRGIVEAFGNQGNFLHSALAIFGPSDVVALLDAEGVPTKVESTGKVFPSSDRASDVLGAFLSRLERSGVQLALAEPVLDLSPCEVDRGEAGYRVVTGSRTVAASAVVLATGGKSYPGCGTTGDGYTWAERLGHSLVPPRPALVPIIVRADWVKALSGVSLSDAQVCVRERPDNGRDNGRASEVALATCRGAMLFTHFGLSGPVVLDVSRCITSHGRPSSLQLEWDFLPEASAECLESWLRAGRATDGKKQVSTLLADRLPRRLADTLTQQAHVRLDCRTAEVRREQWASLVRAVKATVMPVAGTLGFEKAEVTAGGVDLREVDSRTMRSKRFPNLYFVGEILDLDGPIGGYNFQAAFSTGWLAGESV
ncbi:MAG: aminoacetone oxidase family FAD-binding enzyme [Planctomycetes bacterium]|nr:aminoacetone oxidase family FAD-binding enzyme [Planctomycetota bacterium]